MKDNTAIDAAGVVHEPSPEYKRAAARTIAANAIDVAECAELLAMLGLTAEDGLADLSTAA